MPSGPCDYIYVTIPLFTLNKLMSVSSPKKESLLFLRRGNTKNDNSLKRLRIALKSERTIEKTTRH